MWLRAFLITLSCTHWYERRRWCHTWFSFVSFVLLLLFFSLEPVIASSRVCSAHRLKPDMVKSDDSSSKLRKTAAELCWFLLQWTVKTKYDPGNLATDNAPIVLHSGRNRKVRTCNIFFLPVFVIQISLWASFCVDVCCCTTVDTHFYTFQFSRSTATTMGFVTWNCSSVSQTSL